MSVNAVYNEHMFIVSILFEHRYGQTANDEFDSIYWRRLFKTDTQTMLH